MMRRLGLWLVVAACGPTPPGEHADTPTLRIEPADLQVTIVDGVAQTQAYTATLLTPHDDPADVTDKTAFSVANPAIGSWSDAELTIAGAAAGPTRVVAVAPYADANLQSDTGLTVLVKNARADGGGVPDNAGDMFDSATETPGRAPAIKYPADAITVPPNLGALDVHWTDGAGNSLFEIALVTQYVDLRIYKAAATPTQFTPAEWALVGSTHEAVALTVAGLAGTQKGTATQHVAVSNEDLVGGVYYWATTPQQGVMRYDMTTPTVAPSAFFPTPQDCNGCHALSKDGTRMALTTIPRGDGTGTIYDVVSFQPQFATQPWNFATFTPDNQKIVTVSDGVLSLRSSATGAILATIPTTAGLHATHPELSPDGSALANVETTGGSYDYVVNDGSIVTRSFDGTTFGPQKVLVANATSAANYYPSYSPDGQWIAFTRTVGRSYSDPSATIYVIRADGSGAPIRLDAAMTGTDGQTNSWARWAPYSASLGSEPIYWITFSSMRPFGVLPGTPNPFNQPDGVDSQIWMTPFFPARAATGQDPSGPAFRLPFQDFTSSNHIAQWTQAVVLARQAPPTRAAFASDALREAR